jgi:hypothetical protein
MSRAASRLVAALSAATILVGVGVFGYRTNNADLGDGHIGFASVMLAGVTVLVPVIAFTAYRTVRRTTEMVVPISVVSVAIAILTAIGRPGNLFLVGWFAMVAVAVPLLVLAELGLHRRALRRHRT